MANSCQQNNKLSPRKFSEKIALLNKKEAEGNAEFDEIIKEVQATTRSQCSSVNPSLSQNNFTCFQQQPFHTATSPDQSNQHFHTRNHFPQQQNFQPNYSNSSTICNRGIIQVYDESYFITSEQIASNHEQQPDGLSHQQQPVPCFEGDNSRILVASHQQQEQANLSHDNINSSNTEAIILDSFSYAANEQDENRFWLDVPDIKICTINDNQQSQFDLNSHQEPQRASPSEDESLPDITSLQFCSPDQNTYLEQLVISDSSVATIDSPDLEEGKWATTIRRDSHLGYSTNVLNINPNSPPMESENITYLPRVSNLLSNSDCGLTIEHSQDEFNSMSINNNNIIRSYSHNNIDYMTKHAVPNNSPNGHYNNMGQHQAHTHNLQLFNQHHNIHQLNQYGLQINQTRFNNHRRSNTSIRPQYGSTSPIESLSNPNSPQSETQNSPSSSTTEPVEYLPFPVVTATTTTTTTSSNISTLPTQQYYSNQEFYTSCHNNSYNKDTSKEANMNDLFYPEDNSNLSSSGQFREQSGIIHHHDTYYQSSQQINQQQYPVIHNQSLPEVCSSQNLVQETASGVTQIGPGQSPSTRILHNQVCQGSYSQLPIQRGGIGDGKNYSEQI